MQPLDVLRRVDEVAQVSVLLRPEHRVVDEDAVDARIHVRREHVVLDVEAPHLPELETHADVFASLARVIRVRRGGAVLGAEEADERQRLCERGDLLTNLGAERGGDFGGVEDAGHRSAIWLRSRGSRL